MSNPERLIRSIIGDTGSSIYPLACAAEIVGREFFDSHTPLEDVKPGQVYTQVSKEMGISFDAASKRIQRMANFCWECMLKREWSSTLAGRWQTVPAPAVSRDIWPFTPAVTRLIM